MSGESDAMHSDDDQSIRSVDDDDGRIASDKEGSRNSGAESGKEDQDKKPKPDKKPKKKGPVKRMMLSEDELTGKKGLLKLQEMFQNFKFHGKGHEKEDLDLLLYKYEQWTHIMFPKHPFAQVLERIEFLGTKKRAVKVHLKKIRMGMLSNDNDEIVTEEMDENNESDNDNPPPENPDTWSRLKSHHEDGIEDDWLNDDGFPDDDDEIFASIDTGEDPPDVLKKVENTPASTSRSRHDSDSSISSVPSEDGVGKAKPTNSQRSLESPPSRPKLSKKKVSTGNESPVSVRSTGSSSSQSTSQWSRKSLDSPQSVRSSASSSVISRKQQRNSRKGRLRAIMEDSDSDDDAIPIGRRSKRSSDSDMDSDDNIGTRLSKTVLSSDSDDEKAGSSKGLHQKSQGLSGKTSLRRVICSDSDDDGDPGLEVTDIIPASRTQARSSSPDASNGSSDSTKWSKRKRSTKFSEQTTLLIDGTIPTGKTMSSDQSDFSEAESRSGRKSIVKRPRLESSDDEEPTSLHHQVTSFRRRVVSDSDDD